jgi:repressor LexA
MKGNEMQPKVTNEEMLNHIINFITANRYSPSLSELCKMSGIKSKATIHNRLYKMRNEGLIDYKDCENRTISVIGYRYVKEDNKNGKQ